MRQMADVIKQDGTHVYWSTHCRHGRHEDCAATEHAPGVPRRPSQCKVCAAPCVCPCGHDLSGDPAVGGMSLQGIVGPPGEGLHEAVVEQADRYGLDPTALDWHLEAIHGMERHDAGYAEAAETAARCMVSGGCESGVDRA